MPSVRGVLHLGKKKGLRKPGNQEKCLSRQFRLSCLPHSFFASIVACTVALLPPPQYVRAADKGAVAPPAPPSGKASSLHVFPLQIRLDGPRNEQRIGVLGEFGPQEWDLSRDAKLTSRAPGIVSIDKQGVVRPARDGKASITVEVRGQSATIPVEVSHANADVPVSFVREITPTLTRAGCNQGACHGGQHGKGGFRLSLRGFDPAFDYQQIVQSAEGRRVVLADPERSIILLKPTLTMEHGGGERFSVHSQAYERIRQWLEDGAPEPAKQELTVSRLEIWPAQRIMVPGEKQQLLVRATWSDGRSEDVTPLAQFDSLNEGVAEVTPDGLVSAEGKGETYIMVRFGGQAEVARVTLPYAKLAHSLSYPATNFIDEKLLVKWKELGLTPSPLCSDAEFLRRINLDTIGTLPTPAELKKFLSDKDANKRAKAVDLVLNRPEFVDYWAHKWGDLLRINRDKLNDKGMWSFHNWVRASLRENKPIDQFVREIVTAEGSTFTDGPTNFFRTSPSATDWAENAAQIFLGVRMQCARCHHHPFEKWSQDDYYGLAAFFVRLNSKRSQEFGLFGGETVMYVKATGEISHPRKGGVVKPHPLGGPVMDDAVDRRRKLAEWMTAKDNPYFARNIVNRFWGYYMGRGLVEPLDDLRATNPPTNAELLDALAQDFIARKYDLKHLLRTIMNSRAYQLSAQDTPGNAVDVGDLYCTHYAVKRLTAEQLADAVDFVTGTTEKYTGLPPGTRAIQLPDAEVKSYFLDVFGRPARQITCECERTMQPNIAQAMHLLNGDFLNRKIASAQGRIERLFKAKTPVPAIVEELYLVTVSRPPNAAEVTKALAWIAKAPTPREGVQDLMWTLINSREFLFAH